MKVMKLLTKIEKLTTKTNKRLFVIVKKGNCNNIIYDGIIDHCNCIFEEVDFYRFSYDSVSNDCYIEINVK